VKANWGCGAWCSSSRWGCEWGSAYIRYLPSGRTAKAWLGAGHFAVQSPSTRQPWLDEAAIHSSSVQGGIRAMGASKAPSRASNTHSKYVACTTREKSGLVGPGASSCPSTPSTPRLSRFNASAAAGEVKTWANGGRWLCLPSELHPLNAGGRNDHRAAHGEVPMSHC